MILLQASVRKEKETTLKCSQHPTRTSTPAVTSGPTVCSPAAMDPRCSFRSKTSPPLHPFDAGPPSFRDLLRKPTTLICFSLHGRFLYQLQILYQSPLASQLAPDPRASPSPGRGARSVCPHSPRPLQAPGPLDDDKDIAGGESSRESVTFHVVSSDLNLDFSPMTFPLG